METLTKTFITLADVCRVTGKDRHTLTKFVYDPKEGKPEREPGLVAEHRGRRWRIKRTDFVKWLKTWGLTPETAGDLRTETEDEKAARLAKARDSRGRLDSEATKAKKAATAAEMWADPEYRDRQAEARRNMWTPEARERQSKAQQARRKRERKSAKNETRKH